MDRHERLMFVHALVSVNFSAVSEVLAESINDDRCLMHCRMRFHDNLYHTIVLRTIGTLLTLKKVSCCGVMATDKF